MQPHECCISKICRKSDDRTVWNTLSIQYSTVLLWISTSTADSLPENIVSKLTQLSTMDATTIMMDSWSENQTMNMDDALDDLAALTLEIPNMSNQSQPGGGDMLLMTEVSGSTPELLQKTPTQDTLSQDMVSWLLLNAENLPVQNGNMGENLVSTYSYNNPIPMLETKVAPPSPLQLSVSSIGSFLLDPQSEPGLQTSTPRSADSGITSLGTPPRPRGFSCGASPAEDSTKRRRRRTLSEEEQSLRLKRRLEKNRESARICRQRKNQHMQELEVRITGML